METVEEEVPGQKSPSGHVLLEPGVTETDYGHVFLFVCFFKPLFLFCFVFLINRNQVCTPSTPVLYKTVFKTLCSNLFVRRSEADDCIFCLF